MRPELEPIEAYQLIDGLIDQVNVHSEPNGVTVLMTQELGEG